jgi:hypothetical protein
MTIKRLRKVLAMTSLVLFIPGAASPAVAESAAADQDAWSRLAEKRQQRVEELWIRQELRAEAHARGAGSRDDIEASDPYQAAAPPSSRKAAISTPDDDHRADPDDRDSEDEWEDMARV